MESYGIWRESRGSGVCALSSWMKLHLSLSLHCPRFQNWHLWGCHWWQSFPRGQFPFLKSRHSGAFLVPFGARPLSGCLIMFGSDATYNRFLSALSAFLCLSAVGVRFLALCWDSFGIAWIVIVVRGS